MKTEIFGGCKDCRHWKLQILDEDGEYSSDGDTDAARVGFGLCQAILHLEESENKAREDLGETSYTDFRGLEREEKYNRYLVHLNTVIQSARAFTKDASHYKADLYTSPDFFCAKFENTQSTTEGP